MPASNLYATDNLEKKVKSTKSFFFQDGTWRQVATSRCRWLQSLAATCSHLQPLAATCSHLQRLAQAAASGCNWLQVAASGCKWLQVTAFSKIKMMHVCSLSGSIDCPSHYFQTLPRQKHDVSGWKRGGNARVAAVAG